MAAAAAAAARKTHLILFLTILLQLCSRSPATNSTLTQGGAALDFSGVLVSPNGLFSLGLSSLSQSTTAGRYCGVWYTVDPSFFVWIANPNSPIPHGDSGSLVLDRNGTLKLTYSGGRRTIELYSDHRRHSTGLVAELDDTGSFSVRPHAAGVEGNPLWQSFDSHMDVWLPGMRLGIVDGKSRKLTSWLTDSIPAGGAFTLEWDPGREEMVMKRRGVEFWTSGEILGPGWFKNLDLRGRGWDFNVSRVSDSGGDYLTLAAREELSSDRRSNQTSFWRLRYDGGIDAPHVEEPILNLERCDGNWMENGCLRWKGPECRRRDGDKFEPRWGDPKSGRSWVDRNGSLSISDCKEMCWHDCGCGGIGVSGAGDGDGNGNGTGCLFLSSVEVAGRQAADMYYAIVGEEEGSDPPTAAPRSHRTWISISVTGALSIIILLCIVWYRRRQKLRERLLAELMGSDVTSDIDEMEDDGDGGHTSLKVFSMVTIIAATDSFALYNKLGQGGFGPVYKGKLPEGREVAVKRLSKRSGQGLVEFKNELLLIAKLQHRNLVRLLGYCTNGQEKMLVYEYMPNKSLDSLIFDESKRSQLDWDKRYSIIEGIAEGLLYLHKYSRVTIVHRDLKAGNILLDENLNPKISDFGMARIFSTNILEANTNRVVGTYGYMSPEYAMEGTFSTKSDVFSFGVLLLEIVSGRKNYDLVQLDPPINLVGYAWKLWKEGNPLQLMDPTLKDSSSKDQILRCINLGLLCIEDNASDRPTMSEVLSMLTNGVSQIPTPKQPAFTMTRPRSIGANESFEKQETCSTNEVTITMISAR